jgi:hypothetical protein
MDPQLGQKPSLGISVGHVAVGFSYRALFTLYERPFALRNQVRYHTAAQSLFIPGQQLPEGGAHQLTGDIPAPNTQPVLDVTHLVSHKICDFLKDRMSSMQYQVLKRDAIKMVTICIHFRNPWSFGDQTTLPMYAGQRNTQVVRKVAFWPQRNWTGRQVPANV